MTHEVERRCAEAGIPLLPDHPGEETKETRATGDLTVYSIAGYIFLAMEDAQAVADKHKPDRTKSDRTPIDEPANAGASI